MPDRPPKFCRICDSHESKVGPISWRGKCAECSERRELENGRQLKAHGGPFFDHWRRRSLAALGVLVVDERPESR